MLGTEQERVKRIQDVVLGKRYNFDPLTKMTHAADYRDPDKPPLTVTGPDLDHAAGQGGSDDDHPLG